MKKILGLDLGTNSIGAALINMPKSIKDFGKEGNIEWLGSRIVPVDAQYLNKWEAGAQAETKAGARRIKRGARRLKHRYKLRRTRLIQVFKILGWLDENFPENFKKKMNDDENFKFQISDYLPFDKSTIEEATKLLGVENKKGELALPEDWIIYYLRKKALSEQISLTELARVTYMMNQRRGFKSSRKDLKDESVIEIKKAFELTIKNVQLKSEEKNKKGQFTYIITSYNEEIQPWEEIMYKKPEWIGRKDKYVVTWRNGKQLKPQRATNDDWEVVVVALDNEMEEQKKHPGEYFFDELVKDKNYKIRQFPVLRKRYKNELEDIWKKQIELNEDLIQLNNDKTVLQKLTELLYPTQTKANKPKLKEILSNDLLHLISDDIIYYQRELKSQKNSIGECQYEKLKGVDGEIYGVKCAPKSTPEFQEFRIWQDIHNIKILQRQGVVDGFEKVDIDVTQLFMDEVAKEKLFDLFDTLKEVTQDHIFKELNKLTSDVKLTNGAHRINMFFDADKKLLGNETKEVFRKIFRKKFINQETNIECDYVSEGEKLLSDKQALRNLWHIVYSISSSDETLSEKGITTALEKYNIPTEVILAFAKLPEIKKQYASYSSKAINKLLPLMRCGKYWNYENIHSTTKARIEKITKKGWAFEADKRTGEFIKERHFEKQEEFIGLPVWMAGYVVYDRHSERVDSKKYSDLKEFNIMEKLPNNSLRNPIVEQVIRETLFVVKDVWEKYGQPDEIHIEIGRDLKKNAKEREKATKNSTSNFEEKQRIRKLLYELMNNGFEQYINPNDDDLTITQVENTKFEINPNPESPVDIDKFRIWKSSSGLRDADFEKTVKEEKIPKQQEIKKYTLWLSQKCVSPYTGKIIPLSKLFDPTQYEIEHLLPKGLIKNDSFDNLVIAEWDINKAKGRQLAALFIKNSNGKCSYGGKDYKLLEYSDYVEHCKRTFSRKKLQNLLASEIPQDFIERQINDTRYINKKISELLYPVAKGKTDAEEGEEKGGIVFTIGSITTELKREWGLNKEWKKIIKPRFERLEEMTGETYILENKKDRNDIDFNVIQNESLDIKRIDHRHHALDALIIAATTIEHIRYLNSLNAVDTNEELKQVRRALVKGKIREFLLPWSSFTEDAKNKLEETIVTFKSYNQVVSKPQNKYTKWEDKNGKWEKVEKHQEHSRNWMAVRKSLFKEPQGVIYLKVKKDVSVLDAFKIQIERLKVENNKEKRKTASYIYDQSARPLIKDVINKIGIDVYNTEKLVAEIEKFLKKNSKKIETGKIDQNGQVKKKTVYTLGGIQFETIQIVEFVQKAGKRVSLDKDFDHKKIDKIPYAEKSRIPQALHQHLREYERKKLEDASYDWGNSKLTTAQEKLIKEAQSEAFSGEGLEALDKKNGMKIRMVTIKEDVGIKIPFKNKLVEADGNPFFVIHENIITKKRDFSSLSSYDVIKKIKAGQPIAEEREGYNTIILSTNDLVYVPKREELEKIQKGVSEQKAIDWSNQRKIVKRIYRVNDFSEHNIYFKPTSFADAIKSKELHTSFDDKCSRVIEYSKKGERGNSVNEDAVMIKEVCIKLQVDRLGNISLPPKRSKLHTTSNEVNILNEPEAIYQSKQQQVKHFNSFEEANEADAKEMAAISPETHLQNATMLTERVFAEELKQPMDKTLKFKEP